MCDGSTTGCIWRPFFETCHPSAMFDEGTPIWPESSIPTLSLIQSGYMLDDTEAPPTSAPPRSPVVNVTDPWYSPYLHITKHEESGNRLLDKEDDPTNDDVFTAIKDL